MSELKALLGHLDGRSSLVVSWNHKVAMPVKDFLDYATRSLLCKHLCERIFTPFHPAINSSLNEAISAMYHDIQQRETQTVAAKWRANYFKDIYKPRIPDAAAYHVGVLVREFVNSSLSPLLTCFFGEKAGVELKNQHLDRLTQLFRVAWDWNSVLKGEITLQGDFRPTFYGPLHRFDPDVMAEFEPNPREPQPEYVLGTLALGLSSSHAEAAKAPPQHHTKEYVTVLVLGRSGSGKTTFVDNAFSKPKAGQSNGPPSTKPTADVVSVRITTSKHKFKLIDTPGFDNPAISSLEIFTKLANYLLNQARARPNVRGVIYIHRVGDPLESRTLVQNMRTITELFLGEANLSRLLILVVPTQPGSPDSASVAQALPLATAFRHACDKGAKVLISSLDPADINGVIMSYIPQEPVLLRIQAGTYRSPADLQDQIEEYLGYYEKNSLRKRVEEQVQERLAPYRSKIRSLEGMLKESQEKVAHSSESQQQPQQQSEPGREDDTTLRQQLEDLQNENVSLRSQLQQRDSIKQQDSIKQDDIVQTLTELNRRIEGLSRTISAYLVDKYVQKLLGKDPGDVTALHARHLAELAALFGHVEGSSSLMSSSVGAGMPVEDFFDYAIRTLLCKHICRRVFDPFHPGVGLSQSDAISRVYDSVRRRELQSVAGKWRADCFKSIYKPASPDVTTQHIKTIAQKVYRDSVGTITSYFFGQKADIVLEAQHIEQLEGIIRAAWDWNVILKGDVVMLGDIYPVTYPPSTRFDPKFMGELEQSPRKLLPRSILATLALGLVSFRAVGGEHPPEMAVVSKALVATKSLYT
ncbi:hypothetical protein FRC06_000298 [Ceratobasidium sp. 370]|nr:hypothetical protein FRC06_000298 [Ceratobasidium sp. 370]